MKLEKAVRERLGKLPTDLRKLYQETFNQKLESYEQVERSTTEGAMRLLLCLQEPLPSDDFVLALSYSTEHQVELCSDTILDLCSDFIVIDNELDVFRFAHLSVREFLESLEGYEPHRNHAIAVGCCLRYLCSSTVLATMPVFDDMKEIFLGRFHFYSCLYWPVHLFESKDCLLLLPLQALAQNFMIGDDGKPSLAFTCWNDIHFERRYFYYPDSRRPSTQAKIFYGLSRPADCIFTKIMWGFRELLEYRISRDPTTLDNTSQLFGRTALTLACRLGDFRTAQILIDNGAGIDVQNGDKLSPLADAVNEGYLDSVEFLLQNGANPNPELDFCTGQEPFNSFPLQSAAESGHTEILQLLLARNANCEIRDRYDAMPLDYTSANGDEAATKLLLDYTGSLDRSEKTLWKQVTRMQNAMYHNGEVRLKEHLSNWPMSTQATQYLGVVLWNAARKKDYACVELLLASGADVNTVHRKKTVFEEALFRGEPRIRVNGGPTPAEYISKFSDISLHCSANLNGEDTNRPVLPPLITSTTIYYDLGLLRLLTDAGAHINVDDSCDGNPLLDAIREGDVEVAEFLLARGADVEAISSQYFSNTCRLFWDTSNSAEAMLNLLFDYGAEHGRDWEQKFQEEWPAGYRHIYRKRLANCDTTHQPEVPEKPAAGEDKAMNAQLLNVKIRRRAAEEIQEFRTVNCQILCGLGCIPWDIPSDLSTKSIHSRLRASVSTSSTLEAQENAASGRRMMLPQ